MYIARYSTKYSVAFSYHPEQKMEAGNAFETAHLLIGRISAFQIVQYGETFS